MMSVDCKTPERAPSWLARLAGWYHYRSAMRVLQSLNDATLKDLSVSRSDLPHIAEIYAGLRPRCPPEEPRLYHHADRPF